MNNRGGLFAYIFWIFVGFVLGIIFSLNFICK